MEANVGVIRPAGSDRSELKEQVGIGMAVEEVRSWWCLIENERENERDANMTSSLFDGSYDSNVPPSESTRLDSPDIPAYIPNANPILTQSRSRLSCIRMGPQESFQGKLSKDAFGSMESTCFVGLTAGALSDVEGGVGWNR